MAVDKELKDKLDAIIDGLNTLAGKGKGLSSKSNNPLNNSGTTTSSTQKNDVGGFDYAYDRMTEYSQQIREIERETNEIKSNVFAYETAYKRINRLERERRRLLSDLVDLQSKGKDTTQKQYQIARNLNEIERERAKIQSEGYTKLDEANLR